VRHDDYLGGLVAAAPQVFHELCGNRQVTSIEALDLFNAGAGIFCKREDIDLALRQDQPHANRRMTRAVNRPFRLQDGVDFQPGLFHQLIKIPRDDASRSGSVLVLRQKQIVFARRIGVAFAKAFIGSYGTFQGVRQAHPGFAIAHREQGATFSSCRHRQRVFAY